MSDPDTNRPRYRIPDHVREHDPLRIWVRLFEESEQRMAEQQRERTEKFTNALKEVMAEEYEKGTIKLVGALEGFKQEFLNQDTRDQLNRLNEFKTLMEAQTKRSRRTAWFYGGLTAFNIGIVVFCIVLMDLVLREIQNLS